MEVQQDDAVGVWQATKIGANMLTGVFGTTGKAELEVAAKSFREINETILQMRSHPFQIDAKGMEDLMKKVQDLKKNMPWSMDLNTGSTEANLKSLKEMFDYAERVRGIQQKFPNLDQQIAKVQPGHGPLGTVVPRRQQGCPGRDQQVLQITTQSARARRDGRLHQPDRGGDGAPCRSWPQQPPACRRPAAGGEMTASHGGMAFLAGGGRPRGTDVIPAMLSPGEMVMSAATTRRFASQLTAMNAGAKPSYHSQGGHVTNIGDINVTRRGRRHGAANGPLDCHGTATRVAAWHVCPVRPAHTGCLSHGCSLEDFQWTT